MFSKAQKNEKKKLRLELEMKDEDQDMAKIKEEVTKLRVSRRYNTKVQPRAFQPGKFEVKPRRIQELES